MRLDNFRMDLEAKMQTEIARKLYREKERKPVSLGIPKRPSLEQQNEHNLTHYPFAGWCQACLSTRAKEEVHRRDARKDVEMHHADDQYGTVLYIADHHTKAVHAVPAEQGSPQPQVDGGGTGQVWHAGGWRRPRDLSERRGEVNKAASPSCSALQGQPRPRDRDPHLRSAATCLEREQRGQCRV